MDDNDYTQRILAFAAQLHAGPYVGDADVTARERGWLTPEGTPTAAGRDLVGSLDDQRHTRTTFRGSP